MWIRIPSAGGSVTRHIVCRMLAFGFPSFECSPRSICGVLCVGRFHINSLSTLNKMLSSKELDAQSPIKIDIWIDVESEEAKRIMKYPLFTKEILRLNICKVDDLGRLWGEGSSGYYPLHDEYKGKIIGWRVAKMAAN